MSEAYIIGVYSTRFQKWPDRSFKDLTREVYLGVLRDAGLDNGDQIESVWFGNSSMGRWGQACIRGQVCFIPLVRERLFPERVPIINVEAACATGSYALHGAYKDVLSGQGRLALALGVEKIYDPNLEYLEMFKTFKQGIDNFDPEEWMEVYRRTALECGKEFNPQVVNHTIFMETYAIQACLHMHKYGTTQRQIAVSAAKNHHHGALNPKAQYQFEMPVEKVLEDRLVSYPLTRSMCAPISDGAAAALVCSKDFLSDLPEGVRSRAVKVSACALTSGKYRTPDETTLSRVAAMKAYVRAGLGPGDVDVAEVHDATSFCEILQMEMLGFCEEGRGGPFVESGATSLSGKLPVNTSGGLVSMGHPVAATGLSMLNELTTQLRGEAGPRQVKDPRVALLQNGGGLMGLEEAACGVTILEKVG
ncbi:MAG: thiolase family protein [Thermodesulfobacteriota bacterium]